MNNERLDYLDALRTLACFAVVMLHVTAANTYHVEFRSQEWNIFMFYESVVNWAVPMFVMISGSVLLGKEYNYHSIFHKVLRVAMIFFIWSAIYLISDLLINADVDYHKGALWLQVLLQGHYHLWYLIMLCGLYIIVPILKVIVDNNSARRAFLVLSIVFTFLIPSVKSSFQLSALSRILQLPIIGALFRAFCNINDDLSFFLTLGFSAYFVMGYVLARFNAFKFNAFVLGVLLFLVGFLISFLEIRAAVSKDASMLYLKYYQMGIAAQAAGIFLIVKGLDRKKMIIKVLVKSSPMTLGIYLIHPLILEFLQKISVSSLSFSPVISVPVLTLGIFVISAFVSFLIMKSPLAMIISVRKTRRQVRGNA